MIRKYYEHEIPTLVNIWETSSRLAHPFLDEDFTQKIKTAMQDIYLPNSDTWVFEESNHVIGFISMMKNEIGGLFVLPNNHSKGIGTALINHISQFHNELEVEVFSENRIGKPFYKKYGFKFLKEYYHEESKQSIIRMSYILKDKITPI